MINNLTISNQYVLINGDRLWRQLNACELWQLNSTESVRIQLPDYELYLTEDQKEKDWPNCWPNWLLDPSSTPRYLVCILQISGFFDYMYSVIVLVFDQLNDPQFLRRLVLPNDESRVGNPRLLTTKSVEQTALVIYQDQRVYISDLVNDFKEINECNICKYMAYGHTTICIGVHGEMYRNERNDEGDDSYYLDVSFDGERFLFNETKVEKVDHTDFTREEIASCCLPYHMVGEFIINATETRLLWLIPSPRRCQNRNCPIREGFHLLVEQDFLINSRDGNGNEFKKP